MRELIVFMANENIGSLCIFLKNKKNINYMNFIKNNIPDIEGLTLSEQIYYFVNQLKLPILCECGKHKKFIGFKNGYRSTCGNKNCITKKRKNTCIIKYGVDNPKKSPLIIDKEKEKIKNKWGKHYMYNDSIREKFNTTMFNKWGSEWPQQSDEIKLKSKETFENNPKKGEIIKTRKDSLNETLKNNKESILNQKNKTIEKNWGSKKNLYDHINEKIKEKSIINFGVNHHLSSPDIIERRINSYYNNITNKIKSKLPSDIIYIDRKYNKNLTDNIIILKCLKCNNSFEINRQYLVNRLNIDNEICLNCNPILSGTSNMEIELFEFINKNYNGIILSGDKTLIGLELDIYLPELKLAFEFNGLFWHSEKYKEKSYHYNKSKKCLEMGVNLVHIWEDEWIYKKNIIKSIILNKLGKSQKIYARNCKIIELNNNKIIKEFLEENHIGGFIGSKIKLGLTYNNELISLMTFGNLRKPLGQNSKTGYFEMIRFCNKKNITVIGGASKLFKFFIKNYHPLSIVSYCDLSKYNGSIYNNLGFKLSHISNPNYYYIVSGIRKHRFNFRKDKLIKLGMDENKSEIELMSDLGYIRIFDCGSQKWIINF